jgi:hypothetical protein
MAYSARMLTAIICGIAFVAATPLIYSPYQVVGGNTARTDAARWVDNWTEAPEVGVDCTGRNDNATVIQNWINANPYGLLKFPLGCRASISSTITVGSNARNIGFVADKPIGETALTSAPKLIWTGTVGPMFSFSSVDHPTIQNLTFSNRGGSNCLNSYLVFDGTGGTAGRIYGNIFDNGACNNASYIAVSISPAGGQNQENYIIHDNAFYCGLSTSKLRTRSAATNGTTRIGNARGARFIAGDVGTPITLSYAGGFLTTVIASVIDESTITVTDPPAFSQSGVTIHTGTAYGTAIQIGNSANALHETISRVVYSGCHIGINILNGSSDIRHMGGGKSDIAVWIHNSALPISIEYYEAEDDITAVRVDQASSLVSILNPRGTNFSQRGDGFFNFGAISGHNADIQLQGLTKLSLESGNIVIVGQSDSTRMTSIDNPGFAAIGWAMSGYALNDGPLSQPVNTVGENFNRERQTQFSCGPSTSLCNIFMRGFSTDVRTVPIGPSNTAPGGQFMKFEAVCGTNRGTAKLIVYAGTSSTPVTLLDNIGSGVSGC